MVWYVVKSNQQLLHKEPDYVCSFRAIKLDCLQPNFIFLLIADGSQKILWNVGHAVICMIFLD